VDRATRALMKGEVQESACGIIVGPDHRVLVVTNRRLGGWGVPGGKREPFDETIKHTLYRELREEIGVLTFHGKMSFLGCYPYPEPSRRVVNVFHVGVVHGEPFPRETGTEIAWFSEEHLFASKPFGDFYATHFSDGFDHLMPTVVYA